MESKSRILPGGMRFMFCVLFAVVLLALLLCAGGCSTSAPSAGGGGGGGGGGDIVQSFAGDTGTAAAGAATYKDHPDMGIASNGTYVMTATGQTVNVYSTSGVLQSSTVASTFITNAGVAFGIKANDPRIVYDSFISRWLYVCSCANDYLIVSSGSDPTTSTWKGIALSSNSGDLTMHVGYDKNWVYVSEYESSSSVPACTGNAAELFALPGADVAWSGGGKVSLAHEVSSPCHSWEDIPEIDLNASKGVTGPGYFASRTNQNQNQNNYPITLAIDTFTPSSSTAGSFSAAASPSTIATGYLYNTPVDANQPGSPGGVRSVESHRPFSLMTTNGTDMQIVWSSGPCSSSCGAQGADSQQVIFWFDVAIPRLSLIQQVKISDASLGFLFPSLALDGSNNTLIAATGCSTTQYCSIYYFYHLTSDASGVFHGPILATSGTANYQVCTTSPHPGWGTYTTTAQDPLDKTKVWTFQEYAASPTACQWQTRILELQLR